MTSTDPPWTRRADARGGSAPLPAARARHAGTGELRAGAGEQGPPHRTERQRQEHTPAANRGAPRGPGRNRASEAPRSPLARCRQSGAASASSGRTRTMPCSCPTVARRRGVWSAERWALGRCRPRRLPPSGSNVSGIAHLAERRVRDLSLGEKQLVSLAGVMARGPGALLLDEPTSFLDAEARDRLAAILDELSDHDAPRLARARRLAGGGRRLVRDGQFAGLARLVTGMKCVQCVSRRSGAG